MKKPEVTGSQTQDPYLSVWEPDYVHSLVPRHSSQYVMTTATKMKVHCNTFSSLRVEVFSERDEEFFVEGHHIWIEGRLHVC